MTKHTAASSTMPAHHLCHHHHRRRPCLLPSSYPQHSKKTGPNDDNVVWASGMFKKKRFFVVSLQLTCFSLIIGFIYVLTTPLPQNHNDDRHSHHPSAHNHRREQLLTGWERGTTERRGSGNATRPTENGTTRRRGDGTTTGRRNDDGETERRRGGTTAERDDEEAKQTEKKAQETSNDVSWAVGMFF